MKITFCGTGAGLSRTSASAGIFVQHGDTSILLDCGPGSVQNAIAMGLPIDGISALFLSHLHVDHTFGISELLMRLASWGSAIPSIYGPSGASDLIRESIAIAVSMGGRRVSGGGLDRVEVMEVAPKSEVSVNDLRVEIQEVPHAPSIQALAFRVEVDGLRIVYSGDTRPAPDVMVPLAKDADVLIHECYTREGVEAYASGLRAPHTERFVGSFPRIHSPLAEVAQIAARANVGTLVLTHLLHTESVHDIESQASDLFDGRVLVARDGLSLDV